MEVNYAQTYEAICQQKTVQAFVVSTTAEFQLFPERRNSSLIPIRKAAVMLGVFLPSF